MSVWERHFERRAWGFGHRGMLCPWCRLHLGSEESLGVQRYFIGTCLVAALLSLASHPYDATSLAHLLPIAFAGLVLAHELAHAVAGHLVGLHIHALRIGHGRVILHFRVGRTRIEVGSLFLFAGGHCLVSYPGKPARWRDALCSGAPLLMHAALIPLSIAWDWPVPLILLNAWFLIASAYPSTSADGIASDGRQLLALLRNRGDGGRWRYGHLYLPIHFALQDGRSEEAFAAAERALAHFPQDEPLRDAYLQAAVRAGRFESALDAIAASGPKQTDDDEFSPYHAAYGLIHPHNWARFARAGVYIEMERYRDAETELEKAIRNSANEEESAHLDAVLAITRLLDGRPGEPSDAYARLPWVADVQFAQIIAELEGGDPHKAGRTLTQARARARDDLAEGNLSALGAAVLAALGRREQANQRLDRARKTLAEPYAIRYAERWLDRGAYSASSSR